MRPLEGIVVLDLTRLLPGPFATQVLADFGAEVIKVEDTGAGDYMRFMPPYRNGKGALFPSINRDKKSISLDLKNPQAKAAFLSLVRKADVLIEGFRPGVMEKLGLGYDALSQENPRLICCSVTGYGADGPLRETAGHDINYLSLAGITALTGDADGPPKVLGLQVADIGGGALWAIIAILLALAARERTGKGQYCDVSMMDGAFTWLPIALGLYSATGVVPQRGRELLMGGYACYNIYPTADDRYISLGAVEYKFWKAFCDLIGRPQYADLQMDAGAQKDIIDDISAITRTRTRDEWAALFAQVDACATPVLELDEALAHPQIQARQMAVTVDTDCGECLVAGVAVKLSDTPGRPGTRVPEMGEHTRQILAQCGYSDADIDDLFASGAARCP